MSGPEALQQIEKLLASGDPLPAFDAASDPSLEELVGAERLRLRYLRALALARAGATSRSADELAALRPLGEDVDSRLAEDIAALEGRLHKDRALRATGEARRAQFADAAQRYGEAFHTFGGTFSAVNAASMWLLAGDQGMAREFAAQVLDTMGSGPDGTYWDAVTRAEAHLVLGDVEAALTHLTVATSLGGDDVGARASTSRQLRLVADALALDTTAITNTLANRSVVHFCGHRVVDDGKGGAGEPTSHEGVTKAVEEALGAENVGHAYGSLAAGADIIVAEAILRKGAELHVVLPFSIEEFISTSVRPSGSEWVDRFHQCLQSATSVLITCDSGYAGDDSLYAYASAIAMGRARNLATALAADAWQLAIWDGRPSDFEAGTAHDVALWRRLPAARTVVIPVESRSSGSGGGQEDVHVQRRPIRAVLFGDIQGFSKLFDEDLGPFIDQVLSSISAVIERFGDVVIDRNTWGDGLFVAFADPISAARCALDLQDAIGSLDPSIGGGQGALRMRISVHAGPVLSRFDPVRKVETVFGRELTRAARIEPRTPPGEVYATGALAALLRLDPDVDIVPEYVGRVTTAKDFETIPMYVLRRLEAQTH